MNETVPPLPAAAADPARLAALDSYAILDTPAEQEFDDIVLLASRLCDAPVALVSLVGRDRQWFKARIGLEACETPIGASVCAHAIGASGLFVVPDLATDPRTRHNPLVTGPPFIRFYAGARLDTPGGIALGTLCVIDTVPRPDGLTQIQASSLEALARQVMTQLELRRAGQEKALLVQEAHHRVTNSLQMVQSLLMLQARSTTHKDAAQQLQESAGRVRSIGAMHEHLYRAGAALDVDLNEYLRILLDAQTRAMMSPGRSVRLQGVPITWPAAHAASLALMVIELVTNSLKYGAGRVSVTLGRLDGGMSIAVEDEGRALPAEFDPAQSRGLGMRILSGLLNSNGGQLEVDRTVGHTCFRIKLPRTQVA